MRLFLDTANIEEVRDAVRMGILAGVTTNPTLMAKEKSQGVAYRDRVVEICEAVNGPVSAECVSRDLPQLLAEARDVELRTQIVVIEDELLPEQLEESPDQEEQVGGVAGVNDIESAREEHPPGEHEGPGERDRVFHHIAGGARRLDRQVVTVNVDCLDRLELALAAAPGGADDRHDVAGVPQRARLLPDPAIERAGQILD